MIVSNIQKALVATSVLVALTTAAEAASFKSLVDQGYKSSTLVRNKAGLWGWKLTKDKDVQFCKMNVALYYHGKDGLGAFTSAGQMYDMGNKKNFYKSLNITSDDSIPHIEDLKAGHPRPEDTGYCVPFH